MFRFIKRYLRTVGIRGLLRAVGANATQSTVLFSVCRKGIAFPIHLRLNTSDVPTYEDLFSNKDYDFFVHKPPTTIVDAGANIGLASIHFAIGGRMPPLLPSSRREAILICSRKM